MDIQELTQRIDDEYWNTGGNRNSLLKFLSNINEVGKINFIVAYMQNFTMREVNSLFLTLPEIWKDFTVDDWLNLMQAVGDRPCYAPKGQIGDVGIYSDLKLLCRYLEIDGLSLYLSNNQISRNNKLATIKYVKGFINEFVKDEFDYEDLSKGENNIYNDFSLMDLNQLKNQLLKDSRVKTFPQQLELAQIYINQLCQSYKDFSQSV